jgi:hypothetical protein
MCLCECVARLNVSQGCQHACPDRPVAWLGAMWDANPDWKCYVLLALSYRALLNFAVLRCDAMRSGSPSSTGAAAHTAAIRTKLGAANEQYVRHIPAVPHARRTTRERDIKGGGYVRAMCLRETHSWLHALETMPGCLHLISLHLNP